MPSLADIGAQTDVTWQGELSPAQAFMNFASQQFRPGMMRDMFYRMQNPMTARWRIGGGATGQQMPDYLSGYATGAPRSAEQLRALAEQANVLGGMTGAQYGQWAGAPSLYQGPGAEYLAGRQPFEDPVTSWYTQQYGADPQAGERQRDLATLLELQRPTGGEYGGAMRQAITGAMNELYQNLFAQQGPEANFLDWYLQRSRAAG